MLDYPFMRRGEMCAFLTFRSRKSAIFKSLLQRRSRRTAWSSQS